MHLWVVSGFGLGGVCVWGMCVCMCIVCACMQMMHLCACLFQEVHTKLPFLCATLLGQKIN